MDDSYESGVQDCPGTRFVLDLNVAPLQIDDLKSFDLYESNGKTSTEKEKAAQAPRELPEHLSVLFVDDDMVLRKLASRAIRRIQPGWNVQDAASGEAALVLVDTNTFDLIFVSLHPLLHIYYLVALL